MRLRDEEGHATDACDSMERPKERSQTKQAAYRTTPSVHVSHVPIVQFYSCTCHLIPVMYVPYDSGHTVSGKGNAEGRQEVSWREARGSGSAKGTHDRTVGRGLLWMEGEL